MKGDTIEASKLVIRNLATGEVEKEMPVPEIRHEYKEGEEPRYSRAIFPWYQKSDNYF